MSKQQQSPRAVVEELNKLRVLQKRASYLLKTD